MVTESYHLERAVTLCRRLGVDATGSVTTPCASTGCRGLSSAGRENGAVVKAVVDVVSGRDRVFLGRRETTVDEAVRRG